ncbi:hypothetical protein HMPREF1861_00459 [Corynebacterium kroppenstedtii]|nr:hypothetical protein HMPREF1861_00459 [Corynebacterium kroppenstedtii]
MVLRTDLTVSACQAPAPTPDSASPPRVDPTRWRLMIASYAQDVA